MERIVIHGQPITKKNSQQILVNRKTGKPFISPSSRYTQYQADARWEIFGQWRGKPTIDYPVNIKCLFYMETKRRVDLTNLLEAIDDILVHYRIIKDDNYTIVAGHDESRVLYDKDNPRTEITITDME